MTPNDKAKPMLASPLCDHSDIKFPVWASPKLDGIRCIILDGVAYARSLKPIKNEFVQDWAYRNRSVLQGLDGELIVGEPNNPMAFKATTGAIRREGGKPDFTFHVFDTQAYPERPYGFRYVDTEKLLHVARPERTKIVPSMPVASLDDLLLIHDHNTDFGYEGTMVRSPQGLYKNGRATKASQWLMKMKPYARAEAVIIGYKELMRNENEATVDELGHTHRSSHKAGKVPAGTMGVLKGRIVNGDYSGKIVECGTGFTDEERQDFWDNQAQHIGDTFTFEYVPHGSDELPRHPSYKGLRDHIDMSE